MSISDAGMVLMVFMSDALRRLPVVFPVWAGIPVSMVNIFKAAFGCDAAQCLDELCNNAT